jgi:hypothetical protein
MCIRDSIRVRPGTRPGDHRNESVYGLEEDFKRGTREGPDSEIDLKIIF